MSDEDYKPAEQLAHELAMVFLEGAECACGGLGSFGAEWVFNREPKCDCPVESDDYENNFHDINCDTVPCPFCQLLDP
jgi:hypothetical protein